VGEPGRQERLADPAQPEQRHHPTPLVEHPPPEHLALGHAVEESVDIWSFAPGLSPNAPDRRRPGSDRIFGIRLDGLASFGDESLEPGAVEGGPEPGRIAQGGGPQGLGLLALTSSGEAAGLQAHRDERLQARYAGVVGARLPTVDGADVNADPDGELALGQPGPTA
jgi:hypothetical protein